MSDFAKRDRILKSERKHDASPAGPAGLATAATTVLLAADIEAPFKVLLAHPSKWFQPRGGTPTSVVIHCTAATNPASSTAAFFHSSADSGSTQAVADDIEGYTMVPDDAICAGAPPLNQEGLHIEQPGLESWTRDEWLRHDNQLQRVAFHVKGWCDRYGIPMTLLHAADLKRLGEKAKGITYHAAVSEAFHESTHTDPGPGFPWDVFMTYVKGDDELSAEDKAKLAKLEQESERFAKYLDTLTTKLGQTTDPTKPATAEGAAMRVASTVKAAEGGSPGDVPKHSHTLQGKAV